MNPHWRLLVDGPGAGAWNMALDEALLQSAIAGGGSPTLRLYWWSPPTLSLGANQQADGIIDRAALERDGYGLVRRPTGGRAILHAEELTYSVVTPAPDGGTLAAYRWLAEGLQSGLEAAGIEVQLQRMKSTQAGGIDTRHPCFTAAGRYELVSEGRKVVGSAQRRRGGWLMQHGSILLGREHLRLPRYLGVGEPVKESRALEAGTIDCSTLLGRSVSPGELVVPFIGGFSRGLGITLEAGPLRPRERQLAAVLLEQQFGTEAWTVHGIRSSGREATGSDLEETTAGALAGGGPFS